jgi:hypothetical protein
MLGDGHLGPLLKRTRDRVGTIGGKMNPLAGMHRHRFHAVIVGTLTWGIGAAVFFRITLLSGFDVVSGNGGDGRQNLYVHEHLYRWILGRADFASPPIFYPQPNVLGFSDAFLIDLLPYSALRLLGLDPFLAMQLLLIALSAVCFWSVYRLLSLHFGVRVYIALAAATLVAFPNDLFIKASSGHLNTFSLYYIPPTALLVARGLSGFPRVTSGSILFVGSASLLYALLFSTCFYVAWMFGLTVLIAALYAGLRFWHRVVPFLKTDVRTILALCATSAFCFSIGLIPFYVIYGPVLQLFPSWSFREYISFAPFPYDVINVSSWNGLWGWFIDSALAPGRGNRVEQALAVTPGMTLIFLLLARGVTRTASKAIGRQWQIQFAMAAVTVLAISWLLTLKIGSVSLYWLPFHVIPGASAIRVGGRIQLLVNLWIVTGLALLIDRQLSATPPNSRKPMYAMAAAIFLFCMVEQINFTRGGMRRTFEQQALAAVPAPLQECQSFFVTGPGRRPRDDIDAMWISLKTGLPTLNGYSSLSPVGWHLGGMLVSDRVAARSWIEASNLAGQVCLYDEATRRWSRFYPEPEHVRDGLQAELPTRQ